jgi:hypothetical protein
VLRRESGNGRPSNCRADQDARDHLLTLFGFDRWLGQQKQQKRRRPARRTDNAQPGTDVPMPNSLEYAQAKYRGAGQPSSVNHVKDASIVTG